MKQLIIAILLTASSIFGQQITFTGQGTIQIPSSISGLQFLFANTNTGAIVASLPTVLTNADLTVNYVPDSTSYQAAGWRTVNQSTIAQQGVCYSPSQYTVLDNGDGTCTLIGKNTFNTTYSPAQQITNSIYWNADFIAALQQYRNVMRAYQGPYGETNIVSAVTIAKFLGQNPTWYVGTNASNMTLEYVVANDILVKFPQYTNTMQWWQQNGYLVP